MALKISITPAASLNDRTIQATVTKTGSTSMRLQLVGKRSLRCQIHQYFYHSNRYSLCGSLRCISSASSSTITESQPRLKAFNDIPGPRPWPLIGSLPYIMTRLRGREFAKAMLESQHFGVKDFGRIHKFVIPGFTTPFVQLADPNEVIKLFHPEPKYPRRVEMPILDHFMKEHNKIKGVFFADGHDWYRHRSVISKRMLIPKKVSDYSPQLNDVITDFMARLDNIIERPGSEFAHEVRKLDGELFKWAFESISFVLLERRFGCLKDNMNEDAQQFLDAVHGWLNSVFPVSFLPMSVYKYYKTKAYKDFMFYFEQMFKYAELFIDKRIRELDEKKRNLDGKEESDSFNEVGFFEFLIANGKLSRQDIVGSVIDLIFAGVETSSNTVLWSLYMLGKNQDKQDNLYKEITSVLKPGEIPSPETINKMPYLKAWIKETLRLYPVLQSITRQLQDDTELCGYLVPAGTHVQVLSYFLCRDESVFTNAEHFTPERWLRDPGNKHQGVPYSFASIPFGFGKRMCAGRRIAELEMYLLLSRIVLEYKVLYPHEDDVEPETRGAVVPDRDVRVKFIKRN